jgi:hypothetical protein
VGWIFAALALRHRRGMPASLEFGCLTGLNYHTHWYLTLLYQSVGICTCDRVNFKGQYGIFGNIGTGPHAAGF